MFSYLVCFQLYLRFCLCSLRFWTLELDSLSLAEVVVLSALFVGAYFGITRSC